MISSIGGSSTLSQVTMAEMRQRMFSKIDTNGDGKHDKGELAQLVANGPSDGPSVDDILSSFDTDQDGAVSQAEFEAVKMPGPGAQGGPPPMQGGMPPMSSAEFVQQTLSKFDTNGNGKLDADELAEMVAEGPEDGPSAEELMSKLDTDGDNSISESELAAGADKGQQARGLDGSSSVDDIFSQLDANGDGSVSKSEFTQWMEQTMSSSSESSDSEKSDATSTIAQMLDSVLKSYLQWSSANWSQTDVQNVLGAGLSV